MSGAQAKASLSDVFIPVYMHCFSPEIHQVCVCGGDQGSNGGPRQQEGTGEYSHKLDYGADTATGDAAAAPVQKFCVMYHWFIAIPFFLPHTEGKYTQNEHGSDWNSKHGQHSHDPTTVLHGKQTWTPTDKYYSIFGDQQTRESANGL